MLLFYIFCVHRTIWNATSIIALSIMADDRPNVQPAGPSDFPTDVSQFDSDDRISWSKLENKFILESEKGTEYGWDTALRRWVPVVSPSIDQSTIVTFLLYHIWERTGLFPASTKRGSAFWHEVLSSNEQLDEADLEQQQQIYKVPGVEDDEDTTAQKKKRKKKNEEVSLYAIDQ